jgi:hypothetical protein
MTGSRPFYRIAIAAIIAAGICVAIAFFSFEGANAERGAAGAATSSRGRKAPSGADGARPNARDANAAEDDPTDDARRDPDTPPSTAGDKAFAPPLAERDVILDTSDPCDPLVEVEIPPSYDRVTASGVTVTWPPEVTPVEPTALAHTVAGLVHEAARLTATPKRPRLVVMIHPSRDDLHLATGTPEWASGVYDGAVHVVADARADFGVRMPTLRHEVMHAQLHAGVGCMPAWLNEGTAQYFSGRAPGDGLIALLRARAALDFDTLSAPSIVETQTADAARLYAESLAMVLYMVDHGGDEKLADVMQDLHESDGEDPRRRARSLWKRLYPQTSGADVRSSLAKRIFGVSSETELDAIFSGEVCCTGERRLAEYRCHAAAPRPAGSAPERGAGGAARCARY